MECYDFAVVGAGIAGASFAARAAQAARVLVLEQETAPGYHATGRSAALFSQLIGDQSVRALTAASRPFLDHPPAGFCDYPLLPPREALHIGAPHRAAQAAQLETLPHTRKISPHAALERVPVLRGQAAIHAILEPGACDIDVNALHQGFIKWARSQGARFQNRARVRAMSRGSDAWTIETSAGRFRAHTIVNAAGAWADEVAKLAGAQTVGLQPFRRSAAVVELPDQLTAAHWPAVIEIGETFYFKPDAGRLLLSPADESPSPPCDAQPEDWDIAVAIDRVEKATRLHIKHVIQRWAGLRTFAPDRLPVVGYDSQLAGFFWLAGQGGFGVQTAPALSQFAAALALDQPFAEELQAHGLTDRNRFSPSRSPNSIFSPLRSAENEPFLMDSSQ